MQTEQRQAAGLFRSCLRGALPRLRLQYGAVFDRRLAGSLLAVFYALVTGFAVYKAIDVVSGFRLNEEQEFVGADLSIHNINAYPEENLKKFDQIVKVN